MLPKEVTSVSFESFREKSAGKRVILLHPWANFRNIFLSYFLNDVKEGLLYYRIPETMDNLKHWVSGLLQEMQYVIADFGGQLAGVVDTGSPATLGEALGKDLASIQAEHVVLFLDELDRVPQDADFKEFITAFVDKMPNNAQLVVNSRLLTYDPWLNWVYSDQAVVLGTAHRRNNLMFTKEEKPRPQLEVNAFGRGHAIINGRKIKNWDGALSRDLFFYFVDKPLVTRDQIFEVFWPKLSVKDATNIFHVTKREITEHISMNVDDDDNYELTTYSAGFYMPNDKVVRHYDVFDFEEAIERALISDDPHEQEVLFSYAIDIYKAPFLHTVNLPWVEARRTQLQEMYAEALMGMARLQANQSKWEEELDFYIRALKEVPQREDIHRMVMQIYIKQNRLDDAREQYRVLKNHTSPSEETRVLLESIRED